MKTDVFLHIVKTAFDPPFYTNIYINSDVKKKPLASLVAGGKVTQPWLPVKTINNLYKVPTLTGFIENTGGKWQRYESGKTRGVKLARSSGDSFFYLWGKASKILQRLVPK